ncbi:MAG: hypothetical protein IIA14_02565 [SAR324 cluster bacterium]|nr:hypothetical protein [SAR324 cluster bacterium]
MEEETPYTQDSEPVKEETPQPPGSEQQAARVGGRRDLATGRYIPMTGGSRSRLPAAGGEYPRYAGSIGIDKKLTAKISTLEALYQHMGGFASYMPGGALSATISELVEEAQTKTRQDRES